nr:MAG TPA: epsin-1 protein complex protein [Bacteriophage sp.]
MVSLFIMLKRVIYKCMILIDYLCVYGGNIW